MTHLKHQLLRNLYVNKYANWAYSGQILRMIALARWLQRQHLPLTLERNQLLDMYIEACLAVIRTWTVENSNFSDNLPYVLTSWHYDRWTAGYEAWLNSVIVKLLSYAREENDYVRWKPAPGRLLAGDSEFIANLAENYTLQQDDGVGVSLWSSANCHYVIAHGIAYQSVGYHAYNLYNYFAQTKYLWNDALKAAYGSV